MRKSAVCIILIALIIGLFYRYWPSSCLCHNLRRLDGRVALVTDGPSFMGPEIIAELARRGATVYIGSQSKENFDLVYTKLMNSYGDEGERLHLDTADEEVEKRLTPIKGSQLKYAPIHLNSLKSLNDFANHFINTTDRLDFLINNAVVNHGAYFITMDNYESSMAIGHLAHYLLTELLSPLLRRTKPGARIIIISSSEHTGGSFQRDGFFLDRGKFNSIKAFAHVKLANVIHGAILGRKFNKTSVIPVSVHPGYVLPDLGILLPELFGSLFKTRWEAGQSILYLALAPNLQPGGYYSNCQLVEPHAEAKNETILNFVKTESERLIKLRF